MKLPLWPLLVGLFASAPAFAKEVAGVQVPETAMVQDQALALNGAGVRTRFFVKVYVGALYLPARRTDAAGIVAAEGAKGLRLHMLREVGAEQMSGALNDGFSANSSSAELDALKERIEQFRALFPALKRGDAVALDLSKDGATEVAINGAKRGAIPGRDFQQALLRIWLGDKPVDTGLKQAMLGP